MLLGLCRCPHRVFTENILFTLVILRLTSSVRNPLGSRVKVPAVDGDGDLFKYYLFKSYYNN